MEKQNIYSKLSKIQNELKAPKSQYNKFGKYYYRNVEDILESAKPICAKHATSLTVSDEIVNFGERYYIKATATLFDYEGSSIVVTALAREASEQKGMQDSQLTGSTSSYARKYALNGLFNIDDTKDSDFTNTHGKEDKPQVKSSVKDPTKITQEQKNKIEGSSTIDLPSLLKYFEINAINELSFKDAQKVIKDIE